MRILIIASFYPMPDRLGGDNRFFLFIKGLAKDHLLDYIAYAPESQVEQFGAEEMQRYKNMVAQAGITVLPPGVHPALRRKQYDAVLFQYYYQLPPWIDHVRALQPHARVIVDNGDVAFRRFFSKADLTGDPADRAEAERIKREELSAYRKADVLITVSKEDTDVVAAEIHDLRAYVISNIHPLPHLSHSKRDRNTLLFIGSFIHHPNTDGIIYFVREVLPLIVKNHPAIRVLIVGNAPTAEVRALAGEHVQVVGYVPDTAPYLESSYISIAPLRFGAGVKGKIGEAMSYRLPVVTTSIGIDGFGLTPGKNVLVGDTAAEFADHVSNLLHDETLYNSYSEAGYQFICDNFSEESINRRIRDLMSTIPSLPVKKLPTLKRLAILAQDRYERLVGWRIKSLTSRAKRMS